MVTKKYIVASLLVAVGLSTLTSCYDPTQKADPNNTKGNNTGVEYAPQMYHSIPYDPMSQTQQSEKGTRKADSTKMQEGGWMYKYNTNYYNPNNMNMRQPVEGTYRVSDGFEYGVPSPTDLPDAAKDSTYKLAGATYMYPPASMVSIDSVFNKSTYKKEITPAGQMAFEECEGLFQRFCVHCHGSEGKGDGPVSTKLYGVANLHSAAIKNYPVGRIYHVITHGWGSMQPHNTQMSVQERWKIATYVKYLQNQN